MRTSTLEREKLNFTLMVGSDQHDGEETPKAFIHCDGFQFKLTKRSLELCVKKERDVGGFLLLNTRTCE